MTDEQKKTIIDIYNKHISKMKGDKNNALMNQCIGFQWGYDSILDILGYFLVFDIKGKCIKIKSYDKE